MAQMNSNYETLYGVHLLDDLHNYFPALLYDSSSFHSVQSVLQYIQQQTRNRFDLFSYGLREYLSTHPPAASFAHRVIRTSAPSVLPVRAVPPSTFPAELSTPATAAEAPRFRPVTLDISVSDLLQRNQEEEEEEDEAPPPLENALSRALLSLLQIPPGTLTRDYAYVLPNLNNGRGTMDQFLQPVVVRPTAEQINANTTLGNLVSDTEHACAICQDALTSDQEGRKLNACGHWFHKNCIDTWLAGNVHCPVCRHDIREPLHQNQASEEADEDDDEL